MKGHVGCFNTSSVGFFLCVCVCLCVSVCVPGLSLSLSTSLSLSLSLDLSLDLSTSRPPSDAQEKGFECFYVIKNLKQQGSAANTFSMELERFKDYDVPACQALASTSAVYDPATHTFNMTSTTTKQSATYNSTLVADVIAT